MNLTNNITIPGFRLSITAGIITIITTTLLALLIFVFTPFGVIIKEFAPELTIFAILFLIANYIAAIFMLISGFLIKHEEHCFAGSILILIISVIGLIFSFGLYIGPAFGIAAGIIGLREHHKIVLSHHTVLHEHHAKLQKHNFKLNEHHKKLSKKK
jgi:hypothetical protein